MASWLAGWLASKRWRMDHFRPSFAQPASTVQASGGSFYPGLFDTRFYTSWPVFIFRFFELFSFSLVVGLLDWRVFRPLHPRLDLLYLYNHLPPLTLRSLLFLFLFLDVCVSLDSTFVHRSNTHTHRNRLVSTHCRPCTTTSSSSSSSCMRKEQKKRRRGEKKRKTVIGRVCQDGGLGNRAIG